MKVLKWAEVWKEQHIPLKKLDDALKESKTTDNSWTRVWSSNFVHWKSQTED